MARQLLLIRHAKSSWKFAELDDHERPLNKRGIRDSHTVAQFLKGQSKSIDLIYTSSAVRAESLASRISEVCDVPIVLESLCYTFSEKELLNIILSLPNDYASLALIGHNPAITGVANWLAGTAIENVPTSGIVAVEFEGNWSDISEGGCEQLYFTSPKRLKQA